MFIFCARVRVHVCVCTCACARVRVHMCVCVCVCRKYCYGQLNKNDLFARVCMLGKSIESMCP